MDSESLLTTAARIVELIGVAVLLIGSLVVGLRFLVHLHRAGKDGYRELRMGIGRAILLGLEILIIGDIIGTVAVSPTLDDLYVLGLIVLIRTFVSFTLEVEMTGRLPWRGRAE